MKQIELQLQKRLLIVEHDSVKDMEIEESLHKALPDVETKLICKGSELTEEVAKGLVDNMNFGTKDFPDFGYFNYKKVNYEFNTALESFISVIEANGYYLGENPIKEPIENDYNLGDIHSGFFHKKYSEYQEAECKTFNPDKTLIFEIL